MSRREKNEMFVFVGFRHTHTQCYEIAFKRVRAPATLNTFVFLPEEQQKEKEEYCVKKMKTPNVVFIKSIREN